MVYYTGPELKIPMHIIYALIYAICFVIEIEILKNSKKLKYQPYMYGSRIPLFLMTILILKTIINQKYLISFCFTILPMISIYYTLMVLISPKLRKHVQERSMLILWLMPSFLILYPYLQSSSKAMFYFHIPLNLIIWIICIWIIGFITVLLYTSLQHIHVRKIILKDCMVVNDERVLHIWKQEWEHANKNKIIIPLVISSAISSPLTIGMFDRYAYVVLPHTNYSDQELHLIFRHEILHICRKDIGTKFYITFCNALCWYNPFMWFAMRKCSEDIELSCDKAVLEQENDEIRNVYANVILNNAQSESGYTSCLSTKATSLRYRLKNIVQHQNKATASFLVGICFVVLIVSSASYTITYGEYNGMDVVYNTSDVTQFNVASFRKGTFGIDNNTYDIEILSKYLEDATFHDIGKDVVLSDIDDTYRIHLESENLDIYLYFSENIIGVLRYNNDTSIKYYYTKDKIDVVKLREAMTIQ